MTATNNDFDDGFGDDSFLMDFDVDAAISKRNKQMIQKDAKSETSKSLSTPLSNQTNQVPPTSTSSVMNPYENVNKPNRIVNPYKNGESVTSSSGSTDQNNYGTHQQQQQKQSPFGENSKFTIGNVDTTQYMDLPSHRGSSISPRKRYSNEEFDTKYGRPSLASSPPEATNKKQKQTINGGTSTLSTTIPKAKTPSIPKRNTINTKINPDLISQYTSTLEKHFGYKSFRNGQLPIIHTIIHERNDATVFWSTGSGKSLCYQIPPLHMKKIAIIVSPLISLMEDQVSKLNGLLLNSSLGATNQQLDDGLETAKDIAVYLGSGQMDTSAEFKSLQGEYTFVYCTPEKLLSGGGQFLDSLGLLHQKQNICSHDGSNICLFAIDER